MDLVAILDSVLGNVDNAISNIIKTTDRLRLCSHQSDAAT